MLTTFLANLHLSPFYEARLKLTLWYVAGTLLLLAGFTALTFSAKESSYVRVHNVVESNSEGAAAIAEFEQYFEQFNQRFRERVLLFDVVIMVVAVVVSWKLSGMTLQPIQRMVEDQQAFAAEASHELRTPLTTMKMEMEVFRRGVKGEGLEAGVSNLLKSLMEEVEQMRGLVEGLLSLVRGNVQTDTAAMQPVELREVTKRLVEAMQAVAEAKQISLVLKRSMSVEVLGREEQLRQVLSILVDNALKYTPKGGTVSVKVLEEEDCGVMEVKDTGRGIAAVDVERIFERWYRAAGKKRGDSGLGLGLAIAKKLVESHGGWLEVESEVGVGTTFRVLVPKS